MPKAAVYVPVGGANYVLVPNNVHILSIEARGPNFKPPIDAAEILFDDGSYWSIREGFVEDLLYPEQVKSIIEHIERKIALRAKRAQDDPDA